MSMSLRPTISVDRASDIVWDAVVIGAGPSGALAARQIAAAGASVLLIDKAPFPRYKVCGCCLNASSLRVLIRCGLGQMTVLDGAPQLKELCLSVRAADFTIALPSGVAVSRDDFDAALVEEAVNAGVSFLPEVQATVGEVSAEARKVSLAGPAGDVTAGGRVVLVADGLGGRSMCDLEEFAVEISPRSRIGAGASTTVYPSFYETGKIYMACAKGSYVGLVRLSNDRLDIAAAFVPNFCRDEGGPGAAAEHVLQAAGLPTIETIRDLPWRGTPPLTRRRHRIAGERLFVIGDAALYVEPFTGEGMAWALRSAEAVSPLVIAGVRHWTDSLVEQWTSTHVRMIGHHGELAAIVGELIGHERILSGVAKTLAKAPLLADPVLKYITAM